MDADALLERARAFARQDRQREADDLFREALQLDSVPVRREAALHLAGRALAGSNVAEALRMCRLATEIDPSHSGAWVNLGVLLRGSGAGAESATAFQRALRAAPSNPLAALCLGELWEHQGDTDGAVLAYFRALVCAQRAGMWVSRSTIPETLFARVEHAAEVVDEGRKRLLGAVLEPLEARFGKSELQRVRRCLGVFLGELAPSYRDDRQRPLFLMFPDLPATPYFSRSLFPWIEELEARTEAIRREALDVLANGAGVEPFNSLADLEKIVQGAPAQTSWDAVFLYRHGQRYEANCAMCPETLRQLQRIPRVEVRDHAPEILFSILRPGAHIQPHRGVTNTRVVAHLPLVVPPGCALHVLGEPPHAWREGEVVVFDDTFVHEAWNRSGQTRVILLMDAWNPHLDEAERLAVSTLVAAIGDFRVAWEGLADR